MSYLAVDIFFRILKQTPVNVVLAFALVFIQFLKL